MADVSIKIKGIKRLTAKLEKVGKLIEPAVEQLAEVVRKKLDSKRYAPKRSNQRYVRTGRLGRSWTRVEKIRKLVYRVRNTAKAPRGRFYASFVIGERQAWMHRGRWWAAKRVAFEEPPKPIVTLAAEIRKVLES